MIVDGKNISTLRYILISALRFGLENNKESIDRKKALSKFIKSYPELIDYETCRLMQFHIDLYFGRRETNKFDDYRDYKIWKNLYNWLKGVEDINDTRKTFNNQRS